MSRPISIIAYLLGVSLFVLLLLMWGNSRLG